MKSEQQKCNTCIITLLYNSMHLKLSLVSSLKLPVHAVTSPPEVVTFRALLHVHAKDCYF